MLNDEDNSGFNYVFIFGLVLIVGVFISLMVDYFGIFSLKQTIDTEFKNIAINQMNKYLTDEYSSDYVAKFEITDKASLENAIKTDFVSKMDTEKNIKINISSLDIDQPSELTITFKVTGTYKYSPMSLKGIASFDLPVEARAKVIRLDEY